MAVHFDSTKFGSVTVNGEKYKDIFVVSGKIIPRDLDMLHKRYGTGHTVAPEESKQLLGGDVEILVVGTGQFGVLKITDELKDLAQNSDVQLIVKKSPQAIVEFNKLKESGRKVNALIHVTC